MQIITQLDNFLNVTQPNRQRAAQEELQEGTYLFMKLEFPEKSHHIGQGIT
jgi:hypothetical protein